MQNIEVKEDVQNSSEYESVLFNWAGNIRYSTVNIFYPDSVVEVQEYIKKQKNVQVLGTRHCFNRIADNKHALISTKGLSRVVDLDEINNTVTVEGGIKYGELACFLEQHGYALHNMASLPHISVAGSIATATHGSGINNRNLANAVSALEIVTADGELFHLDRVKNGNLFNACIVGLGALGVVTKLTLNLEKTYQLRQFVFTDLSLRLVKEHFISIMSSAYSVSLFTDWKRPFIDEVWIKNRDNDIHQYTGLESFYDAQPAQGKLHPIKGISAENCTEQMGIPGPWNERLPHFKMGFMPSAGNELQSEYFIPLEKAVQGLCAIESLADLIAPYLYISEIRTIAADEFWMSPCYGQSMTAFHFTWKDNWTAVSKILPIIEKELIPLGARPHWGKLFTMPADAIAPSYEKWNDFKSIVARFDPGNKFRNEFLSLHLYGSNNP